MKVDRLRLSKNQNTSTDDFGSVGGEWQVAGGAET